MLKVQKKARPHRSSCWQPVGCVAARAAVARRGGARRGPARGGERRLGCWDGAEGSGAGQQVLGTWPARAAGSGREKNRERGTGGRRRRTWLQFVKSAGTPL
jgi:hypothetical protein